ncbi:MAG: isochorismatase family protein [Xanthobacteraceae bacterium]
MPLRPSCGSANRSSRSIPRPIGTAFFGTGFAGWLTGRGADTLVVAGCTTSGCVRATKGENGVLTLRAAAAIAEIGPWIFRQQPKPRSRQRTPPRIADQDLDV